VQDGAGTQVIAIDNRHHRDYHCHSLVQVKQCLPL
jgi:hypothetical protein